MKNMKRRLLAMLGASAMCVGMLSGCGGGSGSGTASGDGDKTYRVGFVNIDNSDSNCYPAMQNFVSYVESDDFAKAVGADKVEALTADSAGDIEKQTTNVETMLNKGVDMMFIIGVDTQGNNVAVQECNAEGIPVFMVGTEATEGDWKFVGFSETDLGKKQGEWCADNLPKNAKICYLEGTVGREATTLRKEGFQEGIKSRSDVEIISSQPGDFDTATGMQVTEDWIQTYGNDGFNCVVAADNLMAIGAVEALKGAGMADSVITCGVVCNREDCYLMEEGSQSYAAFVNWPSIGTLCGEVAEKVYKGEDVDQETYIELFDVTPDNIAEVFGS